MEFIFSGRYLRSPTVKRNMTESSIFRKGQNGVRAMEGNQRRDVVWNL